MAKKQKKTPQASPRPSTASRSFGGPMDPDLIEQFVRLMRENDVSSLEVSDGPHRVSLQRGAQFASAPVHHVPVAAPAPTAAAPSSPVAKAPAAEDDTSNLKPIKSPMVGTFYSAPSPDAKPFVSVGSQVTDDTDVCVIEAMKVFNNIKAETRGTIAKILVENGKSVEFGTVLFLVKP